MNRDILQVYFICGTADCPHGNILDVIEEALRAGVTCFQFREKGKNALVGQEKIKLARQIQRLCEVYKIPLLINDDVALALEIGADGVHLGQDDMSVEEARLLFPKKIIGLSISSITEFEQSAIDLVDYIGVGPIFPTQSKDDANDAVGNSLTESIRKRDSQLPIVSIGGITAQDVKPIITSGADGVAVISAISRSEDIEVSVKAFTEEFNSL